ncbi:hypothetical protein [Cohnella sp.]|uniref:hypothetical protein n=1 Tax=Cohnella sp. TaxID=1883426 RepID=UPI003562B3D7
METLLIVLFAIGIGYAVLSAIAGDVFGVEFHAGELPFLSPTIIATFLTVFGGVGYMLLHNTGWPALAVAGLSLLIAIGVSSVVLFLVVLPLHAAQKGEALSAKAMIGCEAKVITSIEGFRVGEIVYEQGGTRHNAPARGLEEITIPYGSSVRIVDEIAGTFIVKKEAILIKKESDYK